jgi:hypothetical protein
VVKCNAQGPAGLKLIASRLGSRLARSPSTERHWKAIADGPIPAVHGVVCWRLIDLCRWFYTKSLRP